MILSKGIFHSRRTILAAYKVYKVTSSSIHCLRPASGRIINPAFVSELCTIHVRCESTNVVREKDVILQVPSETSSSTSVIKDVHTDLPSINNTVADDLPEIIADAIVPLNKLGEPTLQSLELGCSYTPVGWIQRLLEFFHVTFEIPWWSSIAICVVIARVLIFPFVIKHQRSSSTLNNVMPEMTALQMKMQTAKVYGNHVEMLKAGQELANFMKENKVSPGSTMILPVIQAPIFISFFIGLRKMASAPVESFKEGGMLWFVDLTAVDPFFALPTITCITLWLTLELGADFSKVPSASLVSRYMPYIIKAIPVVMFPFIMNFPSAVCVYWVSTNFVSLCQVAFLKIPAVRNYFKIEAKKAISADLKKHRKGLLTDVKSSIQNMKLAKQIAERERLDEMNFRRAGKQPPAKTFKYNPTLTSQTIQAKKQ